MTQITYDYTTYLSQAKNFRQRFLVLHYTAENFSASVASLTGKSVSAHYLVPTLQNIDPTYNKDKLEIYCLVSEMERAWHAGSSSWRDRTSLNDSSIGIEIVNMATDESFVEYPDEQVQVIINLCYNILARYPDIDPTNVVGHSDISIGRKKDPGPLFPWNTLYNAGIGAWFDEEVVGSYIEEFTEQMPSVDEVKQKLSTYGYVAENVTNQELLTAFQMHFRPDNYDGVLDQQTAAIAYALCDKYRS
jgi:N-acetylmuramoyl-L-alanine amidase